MAKKKQNRKGNRATPRRRSRPPTELPDRRVMEAVMRQFVAGLGPGPDQDTPQGKAQALVYQAFEEPSEKRRLQLAREALVICPDCADAYVLLAEHAPTRKEALTLYAQGVAAGERALGPQTFQEHSGHFWGLLETRPYMRARQGLAMALWTAGRRDEAVQHLQEMLRLNPNDNQGLRYTLAGFLFFLDRDEELARLLAQYSDEGSATWAYTRALLAFRQHGDSAEARQLLKAAIKNNKHVPHLLTGENPPPREQPSYYSPGDPSEAAEYLAGFLAAWKSTPGAVAWLRVNSRSKKRKSEGPQPKGPLGVIKKWLNEHLPQHEEVWQADAQPMANWVQVDGQMVRPWIVLVASAANQLILARQMSEQKPSPALLWDTLVQAMEHPPAGDAHRPSELHVLSDENWKSLRPHLAEVGVQLVLAEKLDLLSAIFEDLAQHVGGPRQPGMLDVPGMTAERVRSFYEVAAEFYRRAPWKKVGFESAIRIECDQFEGGPWYAVLMGQSGMTMGLALYEDLKTLRQLFAGDLSDEENARRSVATTVTFDEAFDIPIADLDAAQKYGWQVARPDAYPNVFHKERGLSVRPPLVWEMELMEGCLGAVPDFVERHPQDDPARETLAVAVASGQLQLTLSWVTEDQ